MPIEIESKLLPNTTQTVQQHSQQLIELERRVGDIGGRLRDLENNFMSLAQSVDRLLDYLLDHIKNKRGY